MKLPELLRKLLGMKQAAAQRQDPGEILLSIIADAVALNTEYLSGTGSPVQVAAAVPGAFEKFLDRHPDGFISSTFSGHDVPCSALIIGSGMAGGLAKSMRPEHSGTQAGREMNEVIDFFEGQMFRLFLPDPGTVSDYVRLKRSFGPGDHEAMKWRIPDSFLIEIRHGADQAFLMVPQSAWGGLCSSAADKDYAWRLRNISVAEYAVGDEPVTDAGPFSIDITRPAEFILGRLLLPARLGIEGMRISSVFRQASAGIGWPRGEFMTASLDISAGDMVHRLWYGFEGYTTASFAAGFGPFDTFFKGTLRETVSSTRSACPGMKIAGLRYNASAAAAVNADGCVIFRAELSINSVQVNAVVAVPLSYINLAALHLVNPLKIDLLRDTPRARILSVLSLNSAFFSAGISTFMNQYRGGDDRIPVKVSCLPFYEFAELLADSDLRIVAQNFILPRFSGSYMKLFSIGIPAETGSGGRMWKIYRVEHGLERFRRFLPGTMQEKGEGDQSRWTEEGIFDELNRDTMFALYRAVESDRLLLSARARFILKNQFFDLMQQEYREQFEKLRAAGEPFATLDGVPYNVRQLAVSRVTDRDLAMVLMDSGDRMLSVTPLLSRSRKERVMDEIDIARRKFRDGEITHGDMVRGITAVMESVDKEKRRVAE